MDIFNHFINQIKQFIMKLIIILCSFLTLQTCNKTKSEQINKSKKSVEYRLDTEKVKEENNTIPLDTKITESKVNDSVEKDTILNNIQLKITTATYESFAKSNTQKLDAIETFLEGNITYNENLKNYWIAYINYYKTIIAMQLKNKDLGSKSNKKGIQILEANKFKNSDDYALLALIKGLSYNYASGMEAPAISMDIAKIIEKGFETDNENYRVYYAQGSIDFYTPKEFGGGAKTENALLKAINLSEKNINNSHLPTWGKEESFDLLIRYYLREKQKDKAKIYLEKSLHFFPNSYILKKHQSNF
jgi:hypothetical protein